nr:hypothetical protein [Nonomuraea sp. ATCC 55076]
MIGTPVGSARSTNPLVAPLAGRGRPAPGRVVRRRREAEYPTDRLDAKPFGGRLADALDRPAGGLQLGLQFGDAPSGGGRLGLLAPGQIRLQTATDAVLATPGVDRLRADAQVMRQLGGRAACFEHVQYLAPELRRVAPSSHATFLSSSGTRIQKSTPTQPRAHQAPMLSAPSAITWSTRLSGPSFSDAREDDSGLRRRMDDRDRRPEADLVLAGALVQVPATWTLAGVGVVAFGLLPRAAAAISWAAFLFVNLFGEVLGPILGIDYWIAKDAVPYPSLPMVISGEPFTATAIAIMTGVTAVLIAAGLAAVRRRALT